ncbi:HAD family hydrolase [Nocardioides sp. NPDC051685]|uniref:HAD family hydrolase n=1 Tax=Nocardioides sp. NPDC051685 TaxID=3364334 RepID=UPI00378AA9B0
MKPAAVLWDMDGTLVDTEPYWIEAEYAIAERFGATWSEEQAMELVGNALIESARLVKVGMGLPHEPEEIVEMLLDGVVERVEREVPWRPGARELLTDLVEQGVPCALVTMSYARFVAPILEQLPEGAFKVIVTGDMVANGKPHPEPYLTAAAALGVGAADTVAIEDSNTGARSAEAAGCTVLVIENHVPVAPGERRVFRDTLEGMTYADLAAL